MCMCMRMHVHVCMCMYAYAQVTPALLSAAVDEPISRPRDDFSPPEVRPVAPHGLGPYMFMPKDLKYYTTLGCECRFTYTLL